MTFINSSFIESQVSPVTTQNSLHLGDVSLTDGSQEPLYLSQDLRASHIHIIGATGSGKSKLIEYMLQQDMKLGHGACLIDPHGDLYRDLLRFAIEYRFVDRVIPFDLTEDEYVLGFNPISYQGDISFKAKQLREACGKAWGVENWDDTPRLARWLYSVFYVLLEQNLSMLDALTLVHLSHTPKRAEIVKKIRHPQIKHLFQELEQMRPSEIREQLESSYNRLFEFLNNSVIRKMFSQKHSINFRTLMKEGKILLCNLSTRNERLSKDDRNLLGTLLLHEFYSNSLLREQHERTPFYLYIDEFSNFVSLDVAQGLAETRKFKLGYVLAHQDLAQLKEFDERLFKAVMTNTRSKIVCGGLNDEDRELLAKEVFAPDFDIHKVKDEIYQTKQKNHLELREVQGYSTSSTNTIGSAQSYSTTDSTSHSHSISDTDSQSVSKGSTFTQGQSTAVNDTTSQSYQRNNSSSFGQNSSQSSGWNMSLSQGSSWNNGQSENSSHSNTSSTSQGGSSNWSQSQSHSQGLSKGSSSSLSEGTSQSEVLKPNKDGEFIQSASSQGTTRQHTNGQSMTTSTSQQHGRSEGGASTWGSMQGQGSSYGSSTSHSQGGSLSHSLGQNRGSSQGFSSQNSQGENFGTSSSHGVTHTTSTSQSQNESFTQGRSHAITKGSTVGASHSVSNSENNSFSEGVTRSVNQTWVTVQDEYSELSSRSFYSLEEHLHMAKSYLAKLQPASMIVKIHSHKAVPVVVPFVHPIQVKLQWYQGFMKKVSEVYPFFLPKDKAIEPTFELPRPQQHHHNPPKEKISSQKMKTTIPKEEKNQSDTHFKDIFNEDLI